MIGCGARPTWKCAAGGAMCDYHAVLPHVRTTAGLGIAVPIKVHKNVPATVFNLR